MPGDTPAWAVPATIRGQAVVEGTTAFALTRRHEVIAVDTRDGRLRWRQSTGGSGDTTLGERLTLADGLVIAPDGGLVAFDAAAGTVRWRLDDPGAALPGVHVGQAAGGRLFAGGFDGRVRAISLSSGLERWSTPVADRQDVVAFAPVTDGTVVATMFTVPGPPDTGGVVLLDAASGRVRWQAAFPRAATATVSTNASVGLVLADHLVIGVAGDGRIHAFAADDGTLRWTLPAARTDGKPWAHEATQDMRALLVDGGRLIAGSLTGVITAYDLGSREVAWEYYDRWNGSTMFRLGTAGPLLLLPHFSGHVVAVDLASGEERWRKGDFRQGFLWPPVDLGGRLLFTGTEAGMAVFSCEQEQAR